MNAPDVAAPEVLGVIGFGNMGGAIALGAKHAPALSGLYTIKTYDRFDPSARAAEKAGVSLAASAEALAGEANILILAVKPQQVAAVCKEIAPALSGKNTLLISIAAGTSLAALDEASNGHPYIARVMPNTPALVGEGIFGLCLPAGLPDEMKEITRKLFGSLGKVIELPESAMGAFTALSGSGPGFVFHFMESLTEAGVSAGLDRESSRAITLGLLKGCAAMAAQGGEHPAVLRERVSSPGGTTIAGLNHLDRTGTRGHLIDAVLAAAQREKELGK